MHTVVVFAVAAATLFALSAGCETTYKKVFQSFSRVKFADDANVDSACNKDWTVDDCRAMCDNDGKCVAFTFKRNAPGFNNCCYIFSNIPTESVPADYAHQTFVKIDVSK